MDQDSSTIETFSFQKVVVQKDTAFSFVPPLSKEKQQIPLRGVVEDPHN